MGCYKVEKNLPILGITTGDPAGIGPEITAKVLNKKSIYNQCRPIVIGDASVMERAIDIINSDLVINPISNVKEALFEQGTIDVFDMKLINIDELEYGKVSKMCGNAAFKYVEKVIELAMDNQIDATITGPINKEAINLAEYRFSGHTEIYAHYTKTKDYTMMLCDEKLRVVHVSTHVSLREACDRVKKDRVLRVIKLAYEACQKMGITEPKIGVAGLNPHASENGMFGWEEEREIMPAIEEANKEGIKAEGPVPPDTVFSKANGGMYDIVVCMYHDQGHIPLKVLGFVYDEQSKKWHSVTGVNITLGLPIIRCSVDHGTAFDQAGKGCANEESLENAIEYGVKLV